MSRSPGRLKSWLTEDQQYLRNGKATNFKLGTRMEYDDPHHRHARWPPSWKFWLALQVTICRGRGHIVVAPLQAAQLVMPPPLRVGGIKRWYASDVCLSDVWHPSVAYIGPKSRTERPRKTKIGTEVAHVTRDSDTTFKVKRSKVNLQGTYCGGLLHSLLWQI